MAFNADASLLATASTKGTVIRVHRLPQVCGHCTAMLDLYSTQSVIIALNSTLTLTLL
jgi:hypothetical protein